MVVAQILNYQDIENSVYICDTIKSVFEILSESV